MVYDGEIRMRKYSKNRKYPSLYEAFDLGDRVKRVLYDEKGDVKEYRGIILAIDDNSVEIYWDTVDGRYRPENMNVGFTSCSAEEVFEGNDRYSPIKKEKHY